VESEELGLYFAWIYPCDPWKKIPESSFKICQEFITIFIGSSMMNGKERSARIIFRVDGDGGLMMVLMMLRKTVKKDPRVKKIWLYVVCLILLEAFHTVS
jgi:hypothetical protein